MSHILSQVVNLTLPGAGGNLEGRQQSDPEHVLPGILFFYSKYIRFSYPDKNGINTLKESLTKMFTAVLFTLTET